MATTRYARNGAVHLAYQVVGEGDRDVLFLCGGTMPMDALDQHPNGVRILQALQELGRLILCDPRGVGQSDSGESFTPEVEGDDLEAVLDAADARDCLLIANFDACLGAIAYATRRPPAVSHLVMYNGFVAFQAQPDVAGVPPHAMERYRAILDGEETDLDLVSLAAPSEQDDARWREWYDGAGRRGASPATASKRWRDHETADVTPLLGEIAVPTLVIHRESNVVVLVSQARQMAEMIPGAELAVLPGADHVIYAGDAAPVFAAIADFAGTGGTGSASTSVLATVLFTDIVESTGRAAELGDRRWAAVLDAHDSLAERVLTRYSGTLVKTTGDGLLVTFEGPGQALRCAAALRDELRDLGLEIRSGVHTGEVERRGGDIGGIAVHIAARVMAEAGPGEVYASPALPVLLAGSEFNFEERGTRELKGVPGSWQLFEALV